MKLDMAGLLRDRERLLNYLAQENIVPVKAPIWADHPFELRRNEKTLRVQVGQRFIGKKTTPIILDILGVHDEKSCIEVRKYIKNLRKIQDNK